MKQYQINADDLAALMTPEAIAATRRDYEAYENGNAVYRAELRPLLMQKIPELLDAAAQLADAERRLGRVREMLGTKLTNQHGMCVECDLTFAEAGELRDLLAPSPAGE